MGAFPGAIPSINPSASASNSGEANNRSINSIGGQGDGSARGLAQIIAATQGPSANGGWSEILGNDSFGSLRSKSILPIVLIGGVALLAVFLFVKR